MAIQDSTEQAMNRDTETKQLKYELTITADNVVSTNAEFEMDDLSKGDLYIPLDAYFKSPEGNEIRRNRDKNEQRISNRTLPKLAFQLFEEQITNLSKEERKSFPICRYYSNSEMITGIYSSEEEFKRYRNTLERVVYNYGDDRQFVIYCWNLFSPLVFAQEFHLFIY